MKHPRPHFSRVDVEVNSRCNLKCSYCPNAILPPYPVKLMDDAVFERLLSELARLEYTGAVHYNLYNEPLLRKDLERLVQWAAGMLPNALQAMVTNGTLLTPERYARLNECGIHYWIITNHSGDPPNVPERIYRIDDFPISNRGGTIPPELPQPLQASCFDPEETFVVTVTGDVILCCNDFNRTVVLGNIMEQSIEEIWYSEEFERLRQLLAKGNRAAGPRICQLCNNEAASDSGAVERYLEGFRMGSSMNESSPNNADAEGAEKKSAEG